MAVETDHGDDRNVHSLLIVLFAWTALSVPSSLAIGRYLAMRPVEVHARQR